MPKRLKLTPLAQSRDLRPRLKFGKAGNFAVGKAMGFGVFFNHAMISSEPSGIVSKVRGYCALCTAHCATIATVENGRVTRLDPDPEHPNGGVLCLKGKAAPDLVYHPDRLDYPLRRTRPKDDPNPGWERISWDEALDGIVQRLLEIRERFGARAIALAKGTASGTSVDDAQRWLNRFMNAFGSPNSISTIHVCNWHKDTSLHYTFGGRAATAGSRP